jgi:hypothetical protein
LQFVQELKTKKAEMLIQGRFCGYAWGNYFLTWRVYYQRMVVCNLCVRLMLIETER